MSDLINRYSYKDECKDFFIRNVNQYLTFSKGNQSISETIRESLIDIGEITDEVDFIEAMDYLERYILESVTINEILGKKIYLQRRKRI